jgi:hypothetical protein
MSNDIIAMRDKAAKELAVLHTVLEKLQGEARGIAGANDKRAAAIALVREAQYAVAVKADEYGELARTAALLAGGKNHRPLR